MNKWELWIYGWINIAVGLTVVLTLGQVTPNWELKFALWTVERVERHINKKDLP